MHKIYTILLLLLFLVVHAKAQTWSQITRPSGTSGYLDIDFIDANNGAVGSTTGPEITFTTDGGNTWTNSSSIAVDMYSIDMVDPNSIFATGGGGRGNKTLNGGASWGGKTNAVGSHSHGGIRMGSPSVGWEMGLNGSLYKTTNGASTWSFVGNFGAINIFVKAIALNATTAFWPTGANRRIIRTTDGNIWTTIYTSSTANVTCIDCINSNECWVGLSNGTIVKTSNASAATPTWTSHNTGSSFTINDIDFVSPTEGWVAGSGGRIFYTNNGGLTWNSQASGTTQNITGLAMINTSVGYASGTGHTILKFEHILPPEINILGNATTIVDGDNSPDLADHSHFGSILSSGTVTRTYTIDNSAGAGDLTISSIVLSGTQSSDFVVGGISLPVTIAAGNSTTFTLTFTPSIFGTHNATVTINNNDADEAAYDFAVAANVTPPHATSGNFAGPILNPFSLTDPSDRLAPTFGDLDNDGDLDMLWGSEYAVLGYFENIGTNSAPNYAPSQTLPFGLTDQGNESRPRFVDLDNDGDLDLMIAVNTGLTYFENIGTVSTPNFGAAQTDPFGLASLGVYYSTPTFGDLDNDGDLDLILGSNNGDFTHIENIGTLSAPNFDFAGRTSNPYGLTSIGNAGNWSSPYLVDWDNDGDMDLMASEVGTVINYFENTGTSSAPNFATVQQNPFCLAPINGLTGIETADLDFDGDQDIIIGSNLGFYFFEGNVFAEIDVQGNSNSISNGDNTPSIADHTDFGDAVFCFNQTVTRTFTIDNAVGNIDLNINNVSSSNTNFVISNITTPLILTPGSSTTFDVTFTPTSLGAANATITISNDDCDEAPYTFGIQGNGTDPAIDIVRDQALDFDGIDDEVRTGITTTNNQITTEAWVKLNSIGSNGTVLSKWTAGGSRDFNLSYSSSLNTFYIQIRNGGIANADITTAPNVNANQWYHLAMTYDGSVLNLYFNGVNVGSATISNAYGSTASEILIGNINGISQSIHGTIDEVRIWNTARTESEIRENMHLTLSGCEADLLAYYQMNDGTGSSNLTDKSDNGHDGSLTNMSPATDWITSGVNVGNDASNNSNSQTITGLPVGVSTQNFTAANLGMRFFAHSAIEDYTVTYQEFTPNVITGATGINIIQNPMWTVNKSSSTATQLVDYTFTFPAATFTSLDPAKYSLYWRAMNAEGTWTKIATAHSVTSTTVGFGKISLTGQFIVVQESDDLISDVRGNMYEFDGANDYINAGNLNFINSGNPNEYTTEVWIKLDAYNPSYSYFYGDETSANRGILWEISPTGFVTTYHPSVGRRSSSNIQVQLNEWTHLTLVQNGANVTSYVNGVLDAVLLTAPNLHIETAVSTFIGRFPGSGRLLDGALDEIRIWNVARTQAEIRENLHLTLKGNETGLVSYYQFNNDDAVGTVGGVKDAMGTNDATTLNMASTAYVASEIAVAGGISDRVTIGGAGLINFPNTGVDIQFGSTTPNGEIVVYRLETEKPHGWESIGGDVDNEYFVVENFGTNQSFDPLVDLTFNRLSYISPADVGLPQASSPLQLYKRGDNDFGATWGTSWGGADNASAGTNGSISYNTTNGLNSFSQLVVVNAALNSDLPVELMRFDAKRSNRDQVELSWSTASELNNQGFFIERMLEGEIEFKSIGFVEGLGTTTSISNYQFIDENSYPDISYYRLKQVDFDGTATYSEIKAVAGDADITENNTKYIDVSIYPNPVYNELKVRFNKLPRIVKTANVQILSINGQILHHFSAGLQSYQVLEIEYVSQLTPALYLLSIELDNGEKILQKFIKK